MYFCRPLSRFQNRSLGVPFSSILFKGTSLSVYFSASFPKGTYYIIKMDLFEQFYENTCLGVPFPTFTKFKATV